MHDTIRAVPRKPKADNFLQLAGIVDLAQRLQDAVQAAGSSAESIRQPARECLTAARDAAAEAIRRGAPIPMMLDGTSPPDHSSPPAPPPGGYGNLVTPGYSPDLNPDKKKKPPPPPPDTPPSERPGEKPKPGEFPAPGRKAG